MRVWQRLDGWVAEEDASASMYRRVAEAAPRIETFKEKINE